MTRRVVNRASAKHLSTLIDPSLSAGNQWRGPRWWRGSAVTVVVAVAGAVVLAGAAVAGAAVVAAVVTVAGGGQR